MAKAAAPSNVLVNAVRAGITDTPFHEKMGRADISQRISLIPLERAAFPNEISNLVLFLAGDKNSFVTGEVIAVAGGE